MSSSVLGSKSTRQLLMGIPQRSSIFTSAGDSWGLKGEYSVWNWQNSIFDAATRHQLCHQTRASLYSGYRRSVRTFDVIFLAIHFHYCASFFFFHKFLVIAFSFLGHFIWITLYIVGKQIQDEQKVKWRIRISSDSYYPVQCDVWCLSTTNFLRNYPWISIKFSSNISDTSRNFSQVLHKYLKFH